MKASRSYVPSLLGACSLFICACAAHGTPPKETRSKSWVGNLHTKDLTQTHLRGQWSLFDCGAGEDDVEGRLHHKDNFGVSGGATISLRGVWDRYEFDASYNHTIKEQRRGVAVMHVDRCSRYAPARQTPFYMCSASGLRPNRFTSKERSGSSTTRMSFAAHLLFEYSDAGDNQVNLAVRNALWGTPHDEGAPLSQKRGSCEHLTFRAPSGCQVSNVWKLLDMVGGAREGSYEQEVDRTAAGFCKDTPDWIFNSDAKKP